MKPRQTRTHRHHLNPVTGELETTELDQVQLAFERAIEVIDSRMLSMTTTERERLVELLLSRILKMRRNTD